MSDSKAAVPFRAGYVALVGRPNVGKSTLLNKILGQKVSIVTQRPQTTRHQVLGIHSTPTFQIVFVDTPGMHLGQKRALNRYMNRAAEGALHGVHMAVMMVEALRWTDEDDNVLGHIKRSAVPTVLGINKIDKLKRKDALLPFIAEHASAHDFIDVVPISAQRGANLDALAQCIYAQLPEESATFPDDQVTDRSVRFLCAELVREKLTRRLAQELPFGLGVEIEEFDEASEPMTVGAVIWIERFSHKPIVIGKKGDMLKRIGQEAREEMEEMLERRVFLRLWVKVRDNWANDERALRQLGYNEF